MKEGSIFNLCMVVAVFRRMPGVKPSVHWVTRVTLHSLRDCDNDWAGREPSRYIKEKLFAIKSFFPPFRFKMTVGALS